MRRIFAYPWIRSAMDEFLAESDYTFIEECIDPLKPKLDVAFLFWILKLRMNIFEFRSTVIGFAREDQKPSLFCSRSSPIRMIHSMWTSLIICSGSVIMPRSASLSTWFAKFLLEKFKKVFIILQNSVARLRKNMLVLFDPALQLHRICYAHKVRYGFNIAI